MDSMIRCTGISKTFEKKVIPVTHLQDRLLGLGRSRLMRIEAVKPCDLRLRPGEWVAIHGANGSGKTTLLKMIAGLLKPDTGTVEIGGTLSAFFELGIGFHPEKTARENIRLHGILHGFSRREIEMMTDEVLSFADIGRFADLPLKCYSTGMRLRLSFAASAHADADLYLFDEILAVGDEAFQKKCMEYVAGLKAAGKTAILAGPNRSALMKFADRMLVMEDGTLREAPPMGRGGENRYDRRDANDEKRTPLGQRSRGLGRGDAGAPRA